MSKFTIKTFSSFENCNIRCFCFSFVSYRFNFEGEHSSRDFIRRYVEWSLHQPTENEWHWTGDADVVEFINIAQEEGLFVLLRPGPYICAERDFVSISRKCCIFSFSISSFMKINNVLYLGWTSILVTRTSAGHKFAYKRSTWEFLTIFNCRLFLKFFP